MPFEPDRQSIRERARRAAFEELRRSGGRRWISIEGPSMRPLIPSAGWALVDFDDRSPRVGRVVIADLGSRMVIHRVIAAPRRRHGRRVVLKGDAELRGDPRRAPEDIFGTVRAIRCPGGRVSSIGLDGSLAWAIALNSRLSSRAAAAVFGLAASLPRPLGRLVTPPLASLTRMPVQVLAIIALIGQSVDTTRKEVISR